MIAEIQVAPSPAGTPEDPHAHVEAAIAVIRDSGLRYEVGPLGTTLEGDDDAVWATLRAAHEAMLAAGAADEVRRADAAGASTTARKALGFEALLAGGGEAGGEAPGRHQTDSMKRATRRYARRQLTWLRKLPGVTHVDVTGRDPEDVAAELDR